MSFIADVARSGNMLAGAILELINSVTERVTLPIPILPAHPVGDVLEPSGDAQRAGADAMERLIDRLVGETGSRVDENAVRAGRRLLANERVVVSGDARLATSLAFTATAGGIDWGTTGRESARVAVYVDGRYHSTVTVLAERDGDYSINLADLSAGAHEIELRDASDTTRRGAGSSVSPSTVAVGAVRVVQLEGDEALVQRHAPIVELRDQDHGRGHSASHSDSPLLLVPAVTRHADGSRTIAYRVAFSNEEGGTPPPKLLATYGRTGDLEPIYRVRVAADGRVLEASYQSALHRWRSFDGTRVGERPVLRVATANNNFSTRVHEAGAGAERWSETAIAPVSAETTDFEIMAEHRWTWTVMAKEILREGKTAASDAVRGRHQIGDPRRYLYTGPLSDAVRGAIALAGGVLVDLVDGRRVLVSVAAGFAEGPQGQGALELPIGVHADAIRGVVLIGVRAAVLDEQLALRELPIAA